jgi:hypothetical protein
MMAYIARAESLVKSHINVSKFMPRLERDKFLDFESFMLSSHRSFYDHKNGNAIDRQENRPFDPHGFMLMLDQFREQVKDGDAQSINGVEEHTKENKYLENPILVNGIYEGAAFSPKER